MDHIFPSPSLNFFYLNTLLIFPFAFLLLLELLFRFFFLPSTCPPSSSKPPKLAIGYQWIIELQVPRTIMESYWGDFGEMWKKMELSEQHVCFLDQCLIS